MPNWTELQNAAITDKNRSLVVSAGAGSGKTSVLTERILQKLLSGSDIDEFLVVTFTNAAAADLKTKLYKNINEALLKQPDSRHLYNQLFKIDSAFVSTIHAFCFDLIRQNFQSLNLSPKLRITDQAESDMLLTRCINDLFDTKYSSKDSGFLMLVKQLTDQKGDKKLIDAAINIYKKVRSYPYPQKWFQNCIEQLKYELEKTKNDFFATSFGDKLKEYTVERIASAFALLDDIEIYKSSLTDKQADVINAVYNSLVGIKSVSAYGYTELRNAISDYNVPSFRKSKTPTNEEIIVSELKSQITDIIKTLRDEYFCDSMKDIYADIAVAVRITEALSKLISELDESYFEIKRERGVLDFSDLEHLSLQLLTDENGNRSILCEKVSEQFAEIYIDEYQDTNPLQDMIFSLIAKDNNKFIVGDVKQSLYRFRNAEPEIFNDYIDDTPDFNMPGKKARVFLSDNFRCDKPIIDFTNAVFSTLYNKTYGSYSENEKLIYGKHITAEVLPVTVTTIAGDSDTEAEYFAKEIVNIKKTMLKENSEPIKYSDIAILLRTPKNNADTFIKALQKYNIPTYSEQNGSFLDAPEILLAVSLLKVVDNPRNDIALTALLRSPVFAFNETELAKIRLSAFDATMFDSVVNCARRYKAQPKSKRYRCYHMIRNVRTNKKIKKSLPTISRELGKKADDFLKTLKTWQTKNEGYPSHKFIWYIYRTTGLYSLASAELNGEAVKKNLLLLYEHSRVFEQTSFRGLSSFISYLDEIYDKDKPLPEAPALSENNNCVRIMSIHKSKGLEFEVCFLANTDKKILQADKSPYVIRRDTGVLFKKRFIRNLYIRNSLLTKIMLLSENKDNMAESLRALYVAFTRARRKLYVTGIEKDKDENKRDSYLDCIRYTLKKRDLSDIVEEMVYASTDESDFTERAVVNTSVFNNENELEKRLNFKYPYPAATVAKLAVSELEQDETENSFRISAKHTSALSQPIFISQKTSSTDIGTAMHTFIQFANFENAETAGTSNEAEILLKKEMLTSEQVEMLNHTKLTAFFESDLYYEIKSANKVWREKRFSIMEDSLLFGQSSGEKIMVQGVIDMFFETDDRITIVDFKTDRITENAIPDFIKRHTAQLKYYCLAIEKMTLKKVTRAILYSFELGRAVLVDI
ncbi:MAG: hypothetical protein A2Y17_07660 [Clostridiales bacterium GWF2_38_85]|nr:MAG: hypothetical protein A2Y17_07660 [Clostridiales bacterium GWF2_38_85]HBL84249.1 hypothetical protein [Clostridiales bacterium]